MPRAFGRSVPHVVPLAKVEYSAEEIAQWKLVRLHPRPDARAAGMRAYDAEEPRAENPHARFTPDWASWDAGWNQRMQEEY